MAASQDLAVIRKALVRELETINHYQELHDAAADPAVRQLMLHLMDEEKEHVAELTAMLRARDPVQDRIFTVDHAAEIVAGHAPGRTAPRAPDPVVPPNRTGGLTVGSLLGQPVCP